MITVSSLSVINRLTPLSFVIDVGEKIHLIGPNGSGKSSLLAALAGVLPACGHVSVAGNDMLKQSFAVQSMFRAYLCQDDKPNFHIKVHQYLMLSKLESLNYDDREFENVVKHLSKKLSLNDKLDKSILHLSGGEWQRVRLAGVCLQIWPSLNPTAELLILDEPTAALDIGQEKMLYELVDEVASFGISVLMANHDLNRALHYADKVLLLNKGDLVEFGPVEDVVKPSTINRVFETKVTSINLNNRTHLLFD
jgi:vitamin B12 transport system ATP-binding protein